MNNNTTNEDLYRLIVNENQHRLNVFKYFNDPFPDDKYYLIDSVMRDYANKLLKRLSFSTNFIRRFILNDNITAACYKLSKLRIDYYNGNYSERGNKNTVFNMLRTIDKTKYKYYFVTIDYAHLTNYFDLEQSLNNMKDIIKRFIHTDIFRKLSGLIVKYETNWNLYNNVLTLTPHYHFIIKVDININSNLIDCLYEYFAKVVNNPDKDISIKPITDTDKSYYNISKYITKDVYTRVFHYIGKNDEVDKYKVPYSDIVYVCLKLNKFQVFNSYKDLHFKLKYR